MPRSAGAAPSAVLCLAVSLLLACSETTPGYQGPASPSQGDAGPSGAAGAQGTVAGDDAGAEGGSAAGGAAVAGAGGATAAGGMAGGGAAQGGAAGAAGRGGGSGSAGAGGMPEVDDCGGETCADGHYCERPSCDSEQGLCKDPPRACNRMLDPVCGCDGKTYGNDCLRRAAGVAASAPGSCPGSEAKCAAIEDGYQDVVDRARSCDADKDDNCLRTWTIGLRCPQCPIVVDATEELEAVHERYEDLGCAERKAFPPCPLAVCLEPQVGTCEPQQNDDDAPGVCSNSGLPL